MGMLLCVLLRLIVAVSNSTLPLTTVRCFVRDDIYVATTSSPFPSVRRPRPHRR